MARQFHIATIVNKAALYDAMRESMALQGFDHSNSRFTVYDNSNENRHDPYQALREFPGAVSEPYVIFCHQDLLFTPQSSATVLTRLLKELDEQKPKWAVAGPAGASGRGDLVMYLNDPTGSYRSRELPHRVNSLDECFLILRRSNYVQPTAGLRGFHLYGTDLCLNAIAQEKECYVIPFPITHLSGGDRSSVAFAKAEEAISQAWRPQFVWAVIQTTCTQIRISAFPFIERWLHNRVVNGLLRRSVPILFRKKSRRITAQTPAKSADPQAAHPSSNDLAN